MSFVGKITNLFADAAMTIPAFPRTKVKAVSDDNGVGLSVLLEEKSDVGHTHIATEVGARPDTWIPTAAEVGARPSNWMPSASEVGARPSNWMPTAAEVGAQEKHATKSCTLTTGGWSNLSQTVNVTGVTANNTVIVTPSPSSYAVYGESGVYCSAQADGKLTFMCVEAPTANLIVNILILN